MYYQISGRITIFVGSTQIFRDFHPGVRLPPNWEVVVMYSTRSNEEDPESRTQAHHAEQMHVTGNTILNQSNHE
jgi:hypothetical protein